MKSKILMVCLGNICRSPMAEGLLFEKIKKLNLNMEVDSCGFESFHLNDHPDYRAIKTMKDHNIDISRHRMRLFRVEDFDYFDHIYIMDHNNYNDVRSMARNENDMEKVDFILNLTHPGTNKYVPDPYYGGASGFEHVYSLLDEATDIICSNSKSI
ncbi:MAG: low molecular weight phosphotyrosine protein phosphatase [Bacteroidales bacterium]|nr:low molecular weight phosphotyrosine protein phosphatase [Bacteroidales bacterium]